jgi:protocatechuate 3,4-dioxygenase beta subunit
MPYANRFFTLYLIFVAFVSLADAKDEAPFPPPPKDVSSVATLVSENELGERLIITGTVFKADRKTPCPDFILYLYQTDATGVYNTTDHNWERPRIRGWIKTDKEGKYEIRTIKPESYPRGRNPAHIHVIVKVSGQKPNWIDNFLFDGDPYLSEQDNNLPAQQGDFSPVMKATKDKDGVLHCKRDIVINSAP